MTSGDGIFGLIGVPTTALGRSTGDRDTDGLLCVHDTACERGTKRVLRAAA